MPTKARKPASKRVPAKAPSRGAAARPKGRAKAVAQARAPVAPPPIRTPKPKPSAKLKIAFKPRAGDITEVLIGSALIPEAGEGLLRSGGAALVVIDAGLPRSLVEPLLRALDRTGTRWDVAVVTPSEENKSLATLEDILSHAARGRMERGDLLIAVGGGVACDVAGLAAALYRRGVRHVLCPTTLLAMVDASVGGKTAVNIRASREPKAALLKNLVGAFHQPARVVCDMQALETLPARHFAAGLAECVKHGLIGGSCGDAGLMDWLTKNLPRLTARDPVACADLVARNIRLKGRVVSADEREASPKPDGGRMMLNLGHTFAHAIETLPGLSWRAAGDRTDAQHLAAVTLGPLLHGEAVGLGLLCAAHAGERLKVSPAGLADSLRAMLARIGLPTRVEGLPPSEHVAERMIDDKKTQGGRLRLILPAKGRKAKVIHAPPRDVVIAAINSVRG